MPIELEYATDAEHAASLASAARPAAPAWPGGIAAVPPLLVPTALPPVAATPFAVPPVASSGVPDVNRSTEPAAQPTASATSTSATALRTLVTLATYNEIENLPRLVDEINAALPGADLLVIDDNSPDGTGRWCDERAATDGRMHCLHRAGKLGLGTATIAAMQYAIEQGYDVVANLDADFSHPPRYLPELLAGLAEREADGHWRYDVMIGSRYVRGGAIEGWPLKRHLMSRAVNFYARWMLGLRPRDCSGAFRCYRVETLRKLDFAAIRSRGYSFQEEVLWQLKRIGARFGEVPITFVERTAGVSKINLREARGALAVIFRLGIKNYLGF